MIPWAHLQVEYYISIILAIGCDKFRPQEWSNQHTNDLKTELMLKLKLTEGASELKARIFPRGLPIKTKYQHSPHNLNENRGLNGI